jgi:hypothetical protein
MTTDSKENGGKNSMKSSCTAEEKPAILHSPHLSIKLVQHRESVGES